MYAFGAFDGTTFTAEQHHLTGHRGRGFYAPQTFSDLPVADGRRIQIGWLQSQTPSMPFNQAMSLPLELKLITTPDGPRLTKLPVTEVESLRLTTHRSDVATLKSDSANPLAVISAELVELNTEFTPSTTGEVVFNVRGATIAYDGAKQELSVNGHRVPAPLRAGKQRLRIFCDRQCLEVFASDGLTYVPMPFVPKAEDLALGVKTTGSEVTFTALQVHELGSIWK